MTASQAGYMFSPDLETACSDKGAILGEMYAFSSCFWTSRKHLVSYSGEKTQLLGKIMGILGMGTSWLSCSPA